MLIRFLLLAFASCALSARLMAQVPALEESAGQESFEMFSHLSRLNVDTPTFGGRQFWGDVVFFQGYRIQQNVLSGHFRLLDPNDIRRAWGTQAECQTALDQIKVDLQLPPMSGKAVILVHGITRSSKSFSTLSKRLSEEGYLVVGFDYPSTRAPLVDSSHYLEQMIASLEGVEQIDLVVHSMGGLLVRTYLMQTGTERDPRINRLVMLGVPNLGARLANLLQKNWLFKVTFGPAGQQLIESPEGFIAKLPTPDFEFAVISGCRGTADGWNPLIPGDDDGTVSVAATRLPGACDSIEIVSLHSAMMWNQEVMDATINFLKQGALRANGIRCPIPLPPKASDEPAPLSLNQND